MKKYLAIDIGGTFIKYATMDNMYKIYEEGSSPTKKVPEEFLTQLVDIIDCFKEEISGIAICMAGFINPVTGENTDFSIGANFKAYNLKKVLTEKYSLPVMIENDSNCAALGEKVIGAAKGCRHFCMITFGTGIGGAIVINDALYRGRNYKAGEVGFTRVGLLENETGIGAEEAGATSVLVKKVSQQLGFKVNGQYIFENLEHPEIKKVYKDWLYKGAMVIGNLAVTLDPEKVLIGGGISENERFIKDLRQAVYGLYPHLSEYTEIIACKEGNKAGKIGALYLLLQSEK